MSFRSCRCREGQGLFPGLVRLLEGEGGGRLPFALHVFHGDPVRRVHAVDTHRHPPAHESPAGELWKPARHEETQSPGPFSASRGRIGS